MNSYHDLRSVRSWLNQMYPSVPILVQRNSQHHKKSYFFIQDAQEKFEDTGRGFNNIVRTVNVHLITEGPSPSNPSSTDAYWKTRRVLDYLQSRLLQERVIPQFLFNEPWFSPVVWTKPGSTGMVTALLDIAVTSTDAYDKESLLSSPTTVSVVNGDHLYVTITNWPKGRPMAKSYTVYLKTGTNPDVYQAIRTVPIAFVQDGATTVEVTSLTPLAGPIVPPTTSKQWLGYLKIDMATTSMFESVNIDDSFHGYLNITLRSRRPERWKPAAPINTAPVTVSVD